jgi:signal transduction histidine kinase
VTLWSTGGIVLLCAAVLLGAGVAVLFMLHAVRASEADRRSAYTRLFTLEKRAQELLADREQSEDIMAAMSDGAVVLDDVGRIVQANPAANRLLGAPVDTSRGERLISLVRTFPAMDMVTQALSEDSGVVCRLQMPGGRHFLVRAEPLRAGGQTDLRVLLLIRDETEPLRTDAMRRDFVANVSHELKTPLAGLSLLASTVQKAAEDDPAAARTFAARLSAEISRLNELVDDLLALSTFEQEGHRSDRGPVDLAELTRAVAAEAAGQPAAAGRALTTDAAGEAMVMGDRVALYTVVRNLLSNALSFTDPGGRVNVTVRVEEPATGPMGGEAVLTIQDDGIGIPKDEQSRVFERFYRVDKARSRETGGTGLGLSIVRHVVEEHRGRIDLESTLGVGSTFTVRLPLASPSTQR